jgi:hypothetical protein
MGPRTSRQPTPAVAVAVLVVLIALTAACGSSNAAVEHVATTEGPASTTATVATTAVSADPDCARYEAAVTAALGSPAQLEPFEGACRFTAGVYGGDFRLSTSDPDQQRSLPDASQLSAVDLGPDGTADLDRGGRWHIEVTAVHRNRVVTVRLSNASSGSDTYPPASGPAQRAPSVAATLSLVRALADSE